MALEIAPVLLSNEEIDSYRDMFGGRADTALARDIVGEIGQDFLTQSQDNPNYFTYQGLRQGTAGVFDDDPETADQTPNERAHSDEKIILRFTNAEQPDYLRAFISELVKTAPGVWAGAKTAGTVGRTIIPPSLAGGPLLIGGALLTTGLAGLGTSMLTYTAADAIENEAFDPVAPIPPSMRPGYEMTRTLGGGAASIFMPWLLPKTLDLGASTLLNNMAAGLPQPRMLRLVRVFEDVIPSTRLTAQTAPAWTVTGELTSAVTSSGGAFAAESLFPGSTVPRLIGEVITANLLPNTLLKAIPSAIGGLEKAEKGMEGLTEKVFTGQQQKLFERINELYAKYGTEELYDELLEGLTSPEIKAAFEDAFPGVDFTAAQRTGDPLLMAIEQQKASGNENLDAARKNAAREATNLTSAFIEGLMQDGSPQAIRSAALLREAMFKDLLEGRLLTNLDRQAAALERIKRADPDKDDATTVLQLNRNLRQTVGDGLGRARKEETDYWDAVGNPIIFNRLLGRKPMLPKQDVTVTDDKLNRGLVDWDTPATGGERSTWNLELLYENADLPRFIQYWDDLKFEFTNDASRKAFLAHPEVKEINSFVEDSRKHLGLKIKNDPRSDPSEPIFYESNNMFGDAKLSKDSLSVIEIDDTDIRPITLKQLTEIRGRVLKAARKLSSGETADLDFARVLGEFSEEILGDLDDAKVLTGDGVTVPDKKMIAAKEAYDTARAYSRALNDVFKRSILGKYFQKKGTGANLLPPEVVLNQLFYDSNAGLSYARIEQLRDFSRFMGKELGETEILGTVDNLLDNYLRTVRGVVAEGKLDPRTGETVYSVDPDILRKWRSENSEVLEMFPQLQIDLANAQSAQRLFNIFKQRSKSTKATFGKQKYIADLTNGVSPVVKILEAIGQKNPGPELVKLFNLGTRVGRTPREIRAGMVSNEYTKALERIAKIKGEDISPEDVSEGFRHAILQAALQKGGGEGMPNPRAVYETLFSPMKHADKTSLMDVATQPRFEIFSPEQAKRLKFMLSQLIRVQAADEAGRLNDPVVREASGAFMDFYLGVIGSAAGTTAYGAMVPGGSGPGAIKAAGIGSRKLVEIFQEIPMSKRMDLLDMVFTDPELTATLLRRPKGPEGVAKQQNRVIQWLQKKGFTAAYEGYPYYIREGAESQDRPDPETTKALEALSEQQKRALTSPVSAVTTPTTVPASAPSPTNLLASAPLQPRPTIASAPQAPTDRARFAALFPFDSTSALIRQQSANQGIGSLVG